MSCDKENTQAGVSLPWHDTPFAPIFVGIWFGLSTGFAEVFLLLVRRYILGRFIRVGQDVLWMAPLMEMILFVAIGLFLYLIAHWWRTLPLLRPAVTIYAFLSAMAVLMMYYPLHPFARLLLSAGIAVQAGSLAARRPTWLIRAVHFTLAWPVVLRRFLDGLGKRSSAVEKISVPAALNRRDFLLGTGATLGALAVGVRAPLSLHEWYGVRQLPAARSGAPNVLLLVLDTVRAASLSLYGYGRETTPEITRFAQRGVVFNKAFTPAPWTLPSHASLFTGRYPHELSASWEIPFDATYPTLAEVLRDHGYATAAFVANTEYCSYETGLNRGFHHYEDYPINLGQIIGSSKLADHVSKKDAVARLRRYEILGRRRAADVNHRFLSWLSQSNGHPFFAFLNYYDAHAPYRPPAPFDTQFGPRVERPNPLLSFGWDWTPDQIRAEQNAYDGAIAYIDQQFGHLLAGLVERNQLQNTLVIVTSDHGEQLGEHGLMNHANSLYTQVLHVPLLMAWPGRIPEGAVIHQSIAVRHLAATILDLLRLETAALPGRSLVPLWQSPEVPSGHWTEPILSEVDEGIRVPDYLPNSRGDMKSLVIENLHYIHNWDGKEELYDLDVDPGEERNLAAEQDRSGGLDPFRSTLERLLREGSS